MLSPYIIHRRPDRLTKQNCKAKAKSHFTQVTAGYLSKAFAAVRDRLPIFNDIPAEKRPTFHEIRSLGTKLYEDQGIDAQSLLGHTNRAMTEKYKDGHEVEWTEVTASLVVKNLKSYRQNAA
jgi:integrase